MYSFEYNGEFRQGRRYSNLMCKKLPIHLQHNESRKFASVNTVTWASDLKPNIYQVWTLYKIILAMQTGGQKEHSEIPDPMFGYGASSG